MGGEKKMITLKPDTKNQKFDILVVENNKTERNEIIQFCKDCGFTYCHFIDSTETNENEFFGHDEIIKGIEDFLLKGNTFRITILDLSLVVPTEDFLSDNVKSSPEKIQEDWEKLKKAGTIPSIFNIIDYLDNKLSFIPQIFFTNWSTSIKNIFNIIYGLSYSHIIHQKPSPCIKKNIKRTIFNDVQKAINAKKFIELEPELFDVPTANKIDLYSTIYKMAQSDSTILITGETGIGKTKLASAIHKASLRSSSEFINRNIGIIDSGLMYSELFGIGEKKATLVSKRKGIFENADKGTLFLDEIGDAPLYIQLAILKAIDEGEITREGEEKPIKIDVRYIFATNVDLINFIKKKEFRKDLYYRINTLKVNIQPLRELKGSLPFYIKYFYNKLFFKLRNEFKLPSDDEIKPLLNYNFPGNIRQLISIISRSIILDISLKESLEGEDDIIVDYNYYDEINRNVWDEVTLNHTKLKELLKGIKNEFVKKADSEGKSHKEIAFLLGQSVSTVEKKTGQKVNKKKKVSK